MFILEQRHSRMYQICSRTQLKELIDAHMAEEARRAEERERQHQANVQMAIHGGQQ